jgi:LmbE family N-acetylglucosaminyl deacetylase
VVSKRETTPDTNREFQCYRLRDNGKKHLVVEESQWKQMAASRGSLNVACGRRELLCEDGGGSSGMRIGEHAAMKRLAFLLLVFAGSASLRVFSQAGVAVDQTNYNVGSDVMARFDSDSVGTASVRYAGEPTALETGISLHGDAYQLLWKIPWSAKTGRYQIDITLSNGEVKRNVASFAVHRQLAKVVAFDLDKTFYTSGDPVTAHIVVQNISNQPLDHLQVEFEAYTYPWIARAADEGPSWKTVATDSLSLAPGATREFRLENAAVVHAEHKQANIYYSAVIRDARQPDHIYDLAFALPAITAPVGGATSKAYPMLYLYSDLSKVPLSEHYRRFYPPAYTSDTISFNAKHTMFASGKALPFSFDVHSPDALPEGARTELRVLDRQGKIIHRQTLRGAASGSHQVTLEPMQAGLFVLEVRLLRRDGSVVAASRLDFAVNDLPRSILLFCAHEDDDTAQPEIIRAAVENQIPIHVVYFTSGDAGGCDRYYMHSCDPSRAMDFGEVRMAEARASLMHLGVPSEDVFFLGLPDGGMEQIWSNYPDSARPYLSVLLASEHSPYSTVAIPNLPYARDAVVKAAEDFIVRYNPDLILTGHPDERHVDHRTNNWVVVKAMQNLLAMGKLSPATQLVVDQVYGPGPQKHAPYAYEKLQFYVSGEAATLSQEASWYYQTQDGNHQQAEITTYENLRRDASPNHFGYYHWPYPHYRILDWQKHAGWNE